MSPRFQTFEELAIWSKNATAAELELAMTGRYPSPTWKGVIREALDDRRIKDAKEDRDLVRRSTVAAEASAAAAAKSASEAKRANTRALWSALFAGLAAIASVAATVIAWFDVFR